MEEKNIKITLEDDGKIIFYNNGVVKKTIEKDCNEIYGQDIIDILDANLDDSFKLDKIQDEDNNSRYKVYKMIYELVEGIIDKLLTNENDFSFDVDVAEMESFELQNQKE